MTAYSSKSNAKRAALKNLGPDALPGVDFELVQVAGKWAWCKPADTDIQDEYWETMAEVEQAIADGAPPVSVTPGPEELDPEPWAGTTTDFAALDKAAGEPAAPKGKAPKGKAPKKPRGYAGRVAAAAAAGERPWPPTASTANMTYLKRYERISALLDAGDVAGLQALQIGGTNTYAKLERAYRDAAVTFLTGASQAMAAE